MTEKFPVYRKYTNNKNYFKIINTNEFTEVSVIGKQVLIKKTEAKIYPDKLFILDLINCISPILKISEDEFTSIEKQSNGLV